MSKSSSGPVGRRTTLCSPWHLALLGALWLASCGRDPVTPTGLGPPPVIADPASLVIMNPLADTMPAFTLIYPMIELRDSLDHRVPIAGVPITISMINGVTSLAPVPDTAFTDASGDARFQGLYVGGRVGVSSAIVFAAPGVDTLIHPVVFTPGLATAMRAIDTTTQTATAGTAVPVPPGVRITDDLGNPVPGVQVGFGVLQGGGLVEPAYDTTGVDGIATVSSWTLGPTSGLNQLQAIAMIPGGWVSFLANGVQPSSLVGASSR